MASDETYTTNADDQQKAAQLKQRLAQPDNLEQQQKTFSKYRSKYRVPSVQIDEGQHKYVLIKASISNDTQYFVCSQTGAYYHRNVAEPVVEVLSRSGYDKIEITGGGRLLLDSDNKRIKIYGFSYGFGLADHQLAKATVLEDPKFADYTIETSNEGY